ncbi:hypothetical protein Hanom_Chr02g00145801 [Helianthus anomalus]
MKLWLKQSDFDIKFEIFILYTKSKHRVNFYFAPCGLVVLTLLPQTFKNGHFTP